MVRNVIEYRGASTAGMLCSHIGREAPVIRYKREQFSIERVAFPLLPAGLRERKVQADPDDRPKTPVEIRFVAVPADTNPNIMFGTENLLDAGCRASECLDGSNDFRQPGQNRFGPLQLAQVIVVAEAGRGNPPLAFEFAELERLNGRARIAEISFILDRRRNEIGGVMQSLRLRGASQTGPIAPTRSLRERMPSM